jgi:[CysO sulfur-carrier protein]-S-L-cysteine hydrolase
MKIARELLDDIIAHAVQDAPDECCGIVSADGDGVAVQVYRTENIEHSPFRFVIEPTEQFRVYQEIEDAGLEMGAIYHSHTRSEPYPSQTDINFAASWPGVLWIIVGTAGDEPLVRTYEIRDGQVIDAELTVG